MKRDEAQAPLPCATEVELTLARIEGSRAFRSSPRHRALLRHLVQRTLAQDLASLKETLIAVEVFGRPAASFDPRFDSIVRVEARRLRQRLAAFFSDEGRALPLHIELPVGSYVPLFAQHGDDGRQNHPRDATRHARDLVERGDHFLRQALSAANLEAALARFDDAVREAPDYAAAYVGLGRAWLNLGSSWLRSPGPSAEHASEALQRALALEADNAIAHVLLGSIQHQFDGDWPAARRSFERALAFAPQTAFVHSAYGRHLTFAGEPLQAERELLLARELDPHYVNTRIHMINLRLLQRRYDDAQAEILAMQDIVTDSMPLAGLAGVLALYQGQADAAIAHYERACALAPEHAAAWVSLAAAQGAAGRVDEADATLARTQERLGFDNLSPYVMAVCQARCGRPDAAFESLQLALRLRDPNLMVLPFDASLHTLQQDPRWPPLLAAVRKPRRI